MTRKEPGERPGRREAGEREPGKLERAAEWLDAKLLPTLGPPPLGPYEDAPGQEARRPSDRCPLCAHPMGEHLIDRSHPNAVLICPARQNPRVESYEPLNEVGMPKRAPEETG